jgi:hypothetical protein
MTNYYGREYSFVNGEVPNEVEHCIIFDVGHMGFRYGAELWTSARTSCGGRCVVIEKVCHGLRHDRYKLQISPKQVCSVSRSLVMSLLWKGAFRIRIGTTLTATQCHF